MVALCPSWSRGSCSVYSKIIVGRKFCWRLTGSPVLGSSYCREPAVLDYIAHCRIFIRNLLIFSSSLYPAQKGFLFETKCNLTHVYPFTHLYRRKKNAFCDCENYRALSFAHGNAHGNPGFIFLRLSFILSLFPLTPYV